MEVNSISAGTVAATSAPAGADAAPVNQSFAGGSALTNRLIVHITSSNRLSGVEKVGLVETVALIDKLKTGDSLRTKLLKDVAAVTNYLESTAQRRQVRRQQSVAESSQQALAALNRVSERLEKISANDGEIQRAAERRLEQVSQESRDVSVQQIREEVAAELKAEHQVDFEVIGAGTGDAPQVDIILPGGAGGEEFAVPGEGGAEVEVNFQIPGAAAEAEGVELGTAHVLDKLV